MGCNCCHCNCCGEDKKQPKRLEIVWTNADSEDDQTFSMKPGDTVTVRAGNYPGTEWGKLVRKKDGTLWIYPIALVVEISDRVIRNMEKRAHRAKNEA